MNTIIFTVGNKDFSSSEIKSKLKYYAQKNNLNIVREFEVEKEGSENKGITGHQEFMDVLDFIENNDGKFVILNYGSFGNSNPIDKINDKYKDLLSKHKFEIKNYSHPCFQEPKNNVKIWRYVNLSKFLDFIQSKTLFFARADIMRSLDKNEGTLFTKRDIAIQNSLLSLDKNLKLDFTPDFSMTVEQILNSNQTLNNHNENIFLKENFINCWHMSEFESFAMWKVYSENFGVCIQSTYEKLYESFEDDTYNFCDEKQKIYIGKVFYINRFNESLPKGNFFWSYVHKGREFSYEQELRCLVSQENVNNDLFKKLKVNLDILIDKIYINPFSPPWFEDNIKNLCEKYNINQSKVIKSNLT